MSLQDDLHRAHRERQSKPGFPHWQGVPKAKLAAVSAPATAPAADADRPMPACLTDKRYTFERLIPSDANATLLKMAIEAAASRRGKEQPSAIFVYGGHGAGKSHILHAIANASLLGGGRPFLVSSADGFMRGKIGEAWLGADALLIDDVQLWPLTNTPELAIAIDCALSAGTAVVVTADRPAGDLASPRLASRLTAAIPHEVMRLDVVASIALLRAELIREHGRATDEVLGIVARDLGGNARFLKQAALRMARCAYQLTPENVGAVVGDLRVITDERRVPIEAIQRAVARHFNITRTDMLSSRRTANIVLPRQVAMYLAKKTTLRSLPEIGRRFGGRDHTTVLHALRKIEAMVADDAAFKCEIEALEATIC